MSNEENILQFEFFHSKGKMTARIFDERGYVTKLAKYVAYMQLKRKVHINAPRENAILNVYARWQINRINKKIDQAIELMREYYMKYVDTHFWRSDLLIACQTKDFAFRPAVRSDYQFLYTQHSSEFSLFIFDTNDLLADENTLIINLNPDNLDL